LDKIIVFLLAALTVFGFYKVAAYALAEPKLIGSIAFHQYVLFRFLFLSHIQAAKRNNFFEIFVQQKIFFVAISLAFILFF
jgi:hypothetical protein